MQPTSLEAYEEVKKTLGSRQHRVLEKLNYNPTAMTNTEIAFALDSPINTITPRVFELRGKGLVVEHEKRKCTITGRMAIAWRVKSMDEIKERQLEMPLTNTEDVV